MKPYLYATAPPDPTRVRKSVITASTSRLERNRSVLVMMAGTEASTGRDRTGTISTAFLKL